MTTTTRSTTKIARRTVRLGGKEQRMGIGRVDHGPRLGEFYVSCTCHGSVGQFSLNISPSGTLMVGCMDCGETYLMKDAATLLVRAWTR